ncbi:hypothetical protein J1N35_021604 [Gossypium stocksii]|uniref:Uncharacterized protein n=1 Tax=Gossypium stocksii TaxID=47602 RepID=A0A9D3VF53_9ROSI|nr:hypothetical protein J1N35_021604 [Gossypium stocksii]
MNEQEEGTKKLNVNTSANQLFLTSQSRADEVGQKCQPVPRRGRTSEASRLVEAVSLQDRSRISQDPAISPTLPGM